jgi:hypothetical protein
VAGARIDRAKQHLDILEHVSKGVQARQVDFKSGPEIVDVRINPWIGGHVISVVQIFNLDNDDGE